MDTAEIRRRFLSYFEQAGHTPVPSASLLLDDPNLLFVNAGMVPFKPYFLGQETPPYDRAASVQKCVRTLDIEEVGKTTRHGTFFQMCGNFSFGDYFKEGAIELAWELVTRSVADGGYGFPEDRLWATVYDDDDEAVELWRRVTGLPDERIQRLGHEGQLLVHGRARPGRPLLGDHYRPRPGVRRGRRLADEDRYLEVWNLVFMQYELSAVRTKDDFDISGSLPEKNIDTGMGLERVAILLRASTTSTRSTPRIPVIERAQELTGRRYGADHADDVRLRVVADHVRSSMMLIGDGVTPGNEGRGYVLRRLLRRAVRSMRLLGFEDRSLPELLPVSRDEMGQTYPELAPRLGADLHRRVRRGGRVPADAARRHRDLRPGRHRGEAVAAAPQLSGDQAFALHDTYGFPIDLTLEMAAEQGLQRRRGRLPPADDRAAGARQGRRAGQEGPAPRRLGLPRRRRLHSAGRSSSPATTRSSPRARCAASSPPDGAVDVGPRGRRGRAGARPHPVLRRGRRPARRPGRHRARQRRPCSRCATCSRRSPGWSCTRRRCCRARSRSAPAARRWSTSSDGARSRARTPRPTWSTRRSARRSARPRPRPARRTRPAGSASTSPPPARCRSR